MSEAYLGEIRIFSFPRVPEGWLPCDGRSLSIQSNAALFSLLGTTYGGNGQTTFALPDLRGRSPLHQGSGPGLTPRALGQMGGAETVGLTLHNLPGHVHQLQATTATATTGTPGPAVVHGAQTDDTAYMSPPANIPLVADALNVSGDGLPHNNMMPSLAVNYCIAVNGIFPSRN